MLATLFKDERCQQLATYGILEKMYLDRIIRGNQLQEFAAMLMPHQKATTADGGLTRQSLTFFACSLSGEAVWKASPAHFKQGGLAFLGRRVLFFFLSGAVSQFGINMLVTPLTEVKSSMH